jgi:dephospho-CoA kinase
MAVPFVGLTGGIGAGKSTALAELESLGAAVLSADRVVHGLYETDAVREAVLERFGAEVFDGAGGVDRAALARRAFARDADRAWLEQLIWPLVGERVTRFREQVEIADPAPPAAVVEAPLLFEADSADRYSATIAIVAADELRAERVAGRDQAELERRERRQLPQAEKAFRATFVVTNDGTREELRDQLAAILARLGR